MEKNLIHHSLKKILNEKKLICPYCNTINEFIFNKKLSNNYIFIFDKKFDYQHPLFLENNEIKNNFILSQIDEPKINELIKSGKILCFKKNKKENNVLLDKIIKDT